MAGPLDDEGPDLIDSGTQRLLQEALGRLPAGVALVEAPSGRVLFRNEQASLILGQDPARASVRAVADYGRYEGLKPDGTPYSAEEWPLARTIRTGEVVAAEEAEIVRADGSRGFIRISSAPVRAKDGRIVAGVVTFHDISESKRAERDRAFLARAGVLLGGSLEPGEILRRLARLAVPDMADLCVVHALEGDRVHAVALAHGHPGRRPEDQEMDPGHVLDPDPPSGPARVLAGGPAELYEDVPDELLAAAARDDAHLACLREAGFLSAMVVPLAGRGGVLGALTFISAECGRRYSAGDLALAEDLGHRAGLAVENARLFEAEQRARAAAEALQAETAVLYRLSDAANRAAAPGEVFAAALDAIRDVLGAKRASVLTFDEAGVMRFRAWRGLSDEYRRAVEGHSPWARDAVDPRPVVVADVREDAALAAFAPLFEKEGIRALAFIPLVYGERLLGKFMLYSEAPRALRPRELERAATIAAQVASAVGRAEAQEALHEASRRKDEFLAMLSHELRNPLAAARNAVHLLATIPADEETRRRCTEVLDRQTGNLVHIVDDLLDVSRITRGRIELRREPVDLRVVVERALAASSDLLAAHEVTATLPAAPLPVDGDPVRLEQVFVNLLANAAKYTASGGRVEVAAGREGGEIVVRVRDSGIGIESERLMRVFDLFDQGGRDLARTQGGLGVGLTIVRGLVDLHGGRVEAHSAGTGQGSEFVVRLPARAELPAAAPAEAPGSAAARRRVLVVDDHVDSCEMLAAMLQAWGHSVDVVTEASAVVDRVRAARPDLVLLDIGLPGTNGYELAQALSADPATRAAILVALTGYGRAADRERALASGFAHHLVKPVQPDVLRSLLDALGP